MSSNRPARNLSRPYFPRQSKRTARERALLLASKLLIWISLFVVGRAFVSPSALYAQEAPNNPAQIEQATQLESTSPWLRDSKVSEALLLQTFLEENQVLQNTVLQRGAEGAEGQSILVQKGTSNTAEVRQEGTSNLATILQVGSYNSTTLLQRGDHNAAGVGLKGSHNDVELLQQGDDNRYLFRFTGSNLDKTGANRLEQIGNGNTMIEIGTNSIPFNVQQRGEGMRMIIRHNTP